jgi:hypothetical protein
MRDGNQIKVFISLLSLICFCAAQEFEVPPDYKFEKKEDYARYEQDVLKCIEYLENIPLDDESALTKDANAFLLKWMTGCPYVKIELNRYVVKLCTENKEFIMLFMGGWTRYTLQHPDSMDSFKGNLAGLESIIKVYQSGRGVSRDKKIEYIIDVQKEGKLKEWLEAQLKPTE